MKNIDWRSAGAVLLLAAATAIGAPAQTYSALVNFAFANGGNPSAALVQGADGNFYGTTVYGGACPLYEDGCGSVFKVTPSGTLTTLHFFTGPDGAAPYATLFLGADGNFYGTTAIGGADCTATCGTIFMITPAGDLTTLYTFCSLAGCADGSVPYGGLIQTADGSLYGTTHYGGASDLGTIFRFVPGGALITVYSFPGAPGPFSPYSGLARGADGNLYGTTESGGSADSGTVFSLIPGNNKVEIVYSFCSQPACADGEYPQAGLIQATDGNLYGTATEGGSDACTFGCGTIFKITPGGAFTTLHSFTGNDGFYPLGGLLEGADGNLYGTTYSGGSGSCPTGTIFEITLAGTLTTLDNLTCPWDPSGIQAPLIQHTNGTFYGTSYGGGHDLGGTVFSLSNGLGPFVKAVPHGGAPGTAVTILGTALAGATGVSFNGTAAEFTVVSDTEISTTVPAGATTGSIRVAVPGATLSNVGLFQVLP